MFKRVVRRFTQPDPRSGLSYGELGASGVSVRCDKPIPNDHSDSYTRPKHKGQLPIYKKFNSEEEAVRAYNELKMKLNTYMGVEFKENNECLYVLIQDSYVLNNIPYRTYIKITIDFSMLCLHSRGFIFKNRVSEHKNLNYYAEKDLKDMYRYLSKLDKHIRRK